MSHRAVALAILLTLATALISALGADQSPQKCDVGPLNRTYGKTQWLVYSCNNEKAEGNAMLVLVSAPGSAAMPFVFFFYVKDGGYRLYGEGTGDKEATGAALGELQRLTERDISDLIVQTRQVQAQDTQSGGRKFP
jgi:hypothetical protein